MPRARIALSAAKATAGGHPNVVIIGAGRSVVLDVTNAAAAFSDLAAKWTEVERPSRKPILAREGLQLAKVSLDARIGVDRQTDVGPRLAALTYIAANAESVVIGHTTPTGAPYTAAWTMTGLSYRVVQRRKGDNAITGVKATIELTESHAMSATAAASAVAAARTAAPSSKAKPVARRYTVRQGDTVWSIAQAFYPGDSGAWKRVASANGLRDVRDLPVGKVLVLP